MFARLSLARDAAALWWHIGLAAMIYGASTILLAFAWYALLRGVGARDIEPPYTMGVYATSQLGKYLPGSVGHYLGRHVLLRRRGLAHRLLVLCAVIEAVMLVAAAVLWAAPLATRYVPAEAPLVWGLTLTSLAVAGALLRRYATRLGLNAPISLAWTGAAFVSYVAFFGAMACTFDVATSFAGTANLPAATRHAAVAASWITGFIVIGAPAGLGVREAVYLGLVGSVLGGNNTLAAVSAFRIATLGGDVVAFVAGWLALAATRAAARRHT